MSSWSSRRGHACHFYHSDLVESAESHTSHSSYSSYDSEYSEDESNYDGDHCDCPVCFVKLSLMALLEEGDQFQVKKLVEGHGLAVNAIVHGDETPLMVACRLGHMNLIDLLLKDLKAEVDYKNCDGRTALMRAASCKQVKVVNTLINKFKADVDAEDVWGATALFYAIQNGHVDVVNALAGTHKADVEHGKISKSERPLMTAALLGYTDIVNLLCIRHKADVNGKNKCGQTALMYACEEGNADVVQALAGRHKAKVDARCDNGLTALHYAAINGRHDIVDLLIGKYGADVEAATTEDKWTALHYAADGGSLATVKVLVNKYDANPRAVDEFGATPLQYAKENSNQDIVKVLQDECIVLCVRARQSGQNAEATGSDSILPKVKMRLNASTKLQRVAEAFSEKTGWPPGDVVLSIKGKRLQITPDTTIGDLGLKRNDCIDACLNVTWEDLHKAIKDNDVSEIKRICALNVLDLNSKQSGDSGSTAPITAILCDNLGALRALLDAGADVNATNERGWTPLMLAAATNRVDAASILIEGYEANLNYVDIQDGWTALFHAVDSDSADVVKVLVEHGANVLATDKAGKSIIQYAKGKGNEEIIELVSNRTEECFRAGHVSPDTVVAAGSSPGESPSEDASKLPAGSEEQPDQRDLGEKGSNELLRRLEIEAEATNRRFAEESRKRAAEEAEQSRQRAIIDEAQRKAAAEEKARIEAIKIRKRAEEEEMRKKREEEEAALHKRHMAEKKAREKVEKALRKQRKKEAEKEAKEKLKALAEEKRKEPVETKEEAAGRAGRHGQRRVLTRSECNDGRVESSDVVDPSDPVEDLIRYAEEGNILNVTFLINHQGVDVNAQHPKTGMTAVMAAAHMGRASTVKSLVKKSAKVDAIDNKGRTALMHAILGNQPAMVRELLEVFGADMLVVDADGSTPMSLAKQLGTNDIVDLLVTHKERNGLIQSGPGGCGVGTQVQHPTRTDESDKQGHDQLDTSETSNHSGFGPGNHHMPDSGAGNSGFFGSLGDGLGEALEDGLEAPPEEENPSDGGFTEDIIAKGRKEWLEQSEMFVDGGPGTDGDYKEDSVLRDLLKDIDHEISEANDANVVPEDIPMPPTSNVRLGGLLATAAPSPAHHLNGASLFSAGIGINDLFGSTMPSLMDQYPHCAAISQQAVPVTAREIESRLRRPPGFEQRLSNPSANHNDTEKSQISNEGGERWEEMLAAIRNEREHLQKQLKSHEKMLARGEKRMKSIEAKLDRLLALIK